MVWPEGSQARDVRKFCRLLCGNSLTVNKQSTKPRTTRHFGLVSCVTDGMTRDIDEYQQLNLPVFGRGFIQQPIRSRCADSGR